MVERGSFRRLLKYCRPTLLEKDIPNRNKLRAEILRRVDIAKGRICDNLKKLPCKVSFTFDAWTSNSGDPYISVTAHYIDAPANSPNVWTLKNEQLVFKEIRGRHTGKNMADVLNHTLDHYKLHGKVRFLSISSFLASQNFMPIP